MAKDRDIGNARAYALVGLSQLVPTVTRAAYKKRSPAGALLMSEWAGIVGHRLAAATEPRRLSGTTLTIACSGPIAMELQHLADSLIERINAQAGRKLVERLRFVQDRLAPLPASRPRRADITPERVAGLPEGDLNDALGRLKAAILSRSA